MKTIKLLLIIIVSPFLLQAQTVITITKGVPVTFYWNNVKLYIDSTAVNPAAMDYVLEYREFIDSTMIDTITGISKDTTMFKQWRYVDTLLDTFKVMTSFIDTLTIGKSYDFGIIPRANQISAQITTAFENNWWIEREGLPPMKAQYIRVKIN